MNLSEQCRRRAVLMEQIGEDGVAIIAATPERIRNRDVMYRYRPDSDFRYLSGFCEPEALIVLVPGRDQGSYILFCRESDPVRETWDGRRAGIDGAVTEYGADQAFPFGKIDEMMPGIFEGRRRVYHTLGLRPRLDRQVSSWLSALRARERAGIRAPAEVVSLDPLLHEMRLQKSAAELALMREAMATSIRAHRRAMTRCKPGMTEYQIAAELHYEFERDGMEPAYGSIVGGGENACILHYVENRHVLRDGDLLLIDAGAEQRGYCADITRTFPVNGRFSDAQREVYEWVLAAQAAAIDAVRPGHHYMRPHEVAVEVLARGLVELGILPGPVEQVIESQSYRRFYMHGTGHWLGMDVHDVGAYKIGGKWRELKPGMVVTVEPGLYIPPGSNDVDERYRGIGIRIEDDVLVTDDGAEVMTKAMPRSVDDIETLMAE